MTLPPRQLLKNLLGEQLAQVPAQHPERTLEVWFQDEARFGQQGCNSRVWAKCPASGQSNAWIMPEANAQTLQIQQLLWRELRQRYLSNRVYANLEALDQALGEAWRRLSDDPERLRQLTHFDWIHAAVDSCQGRGSPNTS